MEAVRFLKNRDSVSRTWTNAVIRCIEMLGRSEFSLDEVYAFESELARQFPHNRFIRPKIRQQLQVLRDRGLLEFRGEGRYNLRPVARQWS